MWLVSYEKKRDTETWIQGGHMMTDAETGVMHLQAKECKGLSVTSKTGRKNPSPAIRESGSCCTKITAALGNTLPWPVEEL